MSTIVSHKDLVVWQKAISLACRVYAGSARLPRHERSGLQRQLRRAAVCVASQIAEGHARCSRAEFIQCLHTARSALAQLETQYTIADRQQWLTDTHATLEEIAAVARLLNGLIRSLVSSDRAAHAKACAPAITTAHPPRPARTHT
jgi:four helix bundle protein